MTTKATATPTAYSSESGRTYRLDTLIGKGGFGEGQTSETALIALLHN